jgi:Uma2 family endonuclease
MVLMLPESALPAKLTLGSAKRMSDEDYFAFCAANPKIRFERSGLGEIIIVPPAGYESDYRNVDVLTQLSQWARRNGRGRVSGPSAEFILPSGAVYSPDAAWVSNKQLEKLTKDQKRKFPRLVPEFIVEVMSPSDRLKAAQEKMEAWMANGVELAWLIDGDRKAIYIYRAGQSKPEKRTGDANLKGEGPIKGFQLDLREIWEGL